MSTGTSYTLTSQSLEDTSAIAKKLASSLKGDETIELKADVGGGKTTFTKALVSALGSSDDATSPSFTLQNIYALDNGEVHHYDFYRLNEAGVVGEELAESISDSKVITVIEWGDIVQDKITQNTISIQFVPTSESSRLISVNFPEDLEYLHGILDEFVDNGQIVEDADNA